MPTRSVNIGGHATLCPPYVCCIVGANALITEGKTFPDGSLIVGSPAKVVRQLTPQEIQFIKLNAEHYVQNFKRFKRDLKPLAV